METITKRETDGTFLDPQWLITPLPGGTKYLLVLSGIVSIEFWGGATPPPHSAKVEIYPNLQPPFNYVGGLLPPLGPNEIYEFEVEQFATFGGFASLAEYNNVRFGYTIGRMHALFLPPGRLLRGIELEIGVSNTDCQIPLVNYYITTVGQFRPVSTLIY